MSTAIANGYTAIQYISTPPPQAAQYYKVMHDFERYKYGVPDKPDIYPNWDWRVNLPEVYNLQPEHSTQMTKEIQELSFALFRYGAPSLDLNTAKKKWTAFMGTKIAFTNYNGFDDSSDPRANHITGENLNKELPKFDKPRICGGALVTGRVEGSDLVIPTINATKPIPSLNLIVEAGIYFTAVSVGRNFAAEFPYGLSEPSLMLLISDYDEMRYPLEKFIKMPAAYNPKTHNPYIYQ